MKRLPPRDSCGFGSVTVPFRFLMKLQPVKVFKSVDGKLQLVQVITAEEIVRRAEERLAIKKRKTNARKNKRQ